MSNIVRRHQIETIAAIYGCTVPHWFGTIIVKCGESKEEIGQWYEVSQWKPAQWTATFERISGKKTSDLWKAQGGEV